MGTLPYNIVRKSAQCLSVVTESNGIYIYIYTCAYIHTYIVYKMVLPGLDMGLI